MKYTFVLFCTEKIRENSLNCIFVHNIVSTFLEAANGKVNNSVSKKNSREARA